MAKPRIVYVCNACAAEFAQYFGKCPSCGTWNSLVEESLPVDPTQPSRFSWNQNSTTKSNMRSPSAEPAAPRAAIKLSQIDDQNVARFPSGFAELDRVLGGGIVPGSLVLVGGEPGIGKSTLLLQVANSLSYHHRVLYVSAEESGQQVKIRAMRLGMTTDAATSDNGATSEENSESNGETEAHETNSPDETSSERHFYLLAETDLEGVLRELESLKPHLAIVDSIQTIYFASLTSAPGSVAQVRECTSALMQVAKRESITLFVVGHVTKEGSIAGPRVLEHLVDTVMFFEGDRFASHRLLRTMKNRFGATHEIGVFEMVAEGLREVDNPSELFLSNLEEFATGSAIIVACEGTRPIVVEVQALVSPTSYGSPRRATTGLDSNRLLQVLAVLEKRVGIPLSKLDTYVASVGGISVSEPAADLGVAVAIVASFRDRVVDPHTAILGEVGLGSQVRPVSQLELRLREAAKLGFKRAIIPKGQNPPDIGLELICVGKVIEAIVEAIPGQFNQADNQNATANNQQPVLNGNGLNAAGENDDFEDDFDEEPVF